MIKELFILIILFIGLNTYAQVEKYHFNYLKSDDGLSSNKINCFQEDSLGFMWIGTDNGLNRFDGSSIKTFKADGKPGAIIHHNVRVIEPAFNSSDFWIGTSRGLCLFNLSTYKASTIPGKIDTARSTLNISVEDLAYDKNGTLWIATRNNIFRYDTTLVQITENEQSYKRNNNAFCSSIAVLPDNNVIFGGEQGVYKYNRKNNKLDTLEHIKVGHVVKMLVDSDGDLWLTTFNNGAFLFKDANLENTPEVFKKSNGKLITDIAFDIIEYKPGVFYIINKEGGITIYDKKTRSFDYIIPKLSDQYGLNTKALVSLGTDSNNNLWVGTFNYGVNYIDTKRKKIGHYFQNIGEEGLFNDNIRSFFEDSKGYIWIGTKEDGGLSRFNIETRKFKHYRVDESNPDALKGDIVTAINEIDERYLLVGTFLKGLNVLDRKTDKFVGYMSDSEDSTSIDDNYVTTIKKDPNGRIIIGHGSGVDLFDPDKRIFTRFFTEKSGRCVFVENSDSIWLGTLRGLFLLDHNGETRREYNYTNHYANKPYALRVNNVMAVKKDKSGTIWLASGYDGIHKLSKDRSSFTRYKYPGSTLKNKVMGMLIDDHDNIWFSSQNGLSKFVDSTKTFYHFNQLDGLQGNQFERHAALKTSKGYMLFGGRNGFNIFHPDRIKLNKTPPRVVLTDFEIFDEEVLVGGKDSILSKHISQTKEIVLNHKQSMLSFEFVAINYSSPMKNEYACMMEGVDKDWRHLENNRSATYTNMTEGDYVFKVKASNNDGVWNEKGVELYITILPPWWRTICFRIILVLTMVGIIFSIYKLRVKQLHHQQRLLRIKVNERTTELSRKNKLLNEQADDLNKINNLLEEKHQFVESQAEELSIQAEELNKSNEELSKLNATKDKFFSIIAHDLRNPFTSILGLCEVLLDDYKRFDDNQRIELIAAIDNSSKNIFQLLENLLHWARSQSNNIKVNVRRISVFEKISALKQLVEKSLVKKNLEMDINISKKLEIDSDPNLFDAIFRNLITNSIKFSSDGKIEVIAEEKSDSVIITVSDCGVGMTQETINNLFKNQHTDSTPGTQGESGTGIGLVICNESITLLGGKLDVESKVGVGSSFMIELPKNTKEES